MKILRAIGRAFRSYWRECRRPLTKEEEEFNTTYQP